MPLSSLLLVLSFLSVSPALAAPKLQDIQGTAMAAETNKPVELSIAYLRKPAELFGRIVDGSGAAVTRQKSLRYAMRLLTQPTFSDFDVALRETVRVLA